MHKTNKKGKPIGRAILSGFIFDFSEPLNPISAANNSDYQVDAIIKKRVKKRTERVLQPIRSFAASYRASADSITLKFNGKQAFPKGGEITVVGGSTSGLTSMYRRHTFRKSGLYDLTAWPRHHRSVSPSRPPRVIGPRLAHAEKSKRKPCRLDFMGSLSDLQQELQQNLWKPCESHGIHVNHGKS